MPENALLFELGQRMKDVLDPFYKRVHKELRDSAADLIVTHWLSRVRRALRTKDLVELDQRTLYPLASDDKWPDTRPKVYAQLLITEEQGETFLRECLLQYLSNSDTVDTRRLPYEGQLMVRNNQIMVGVRR